jgi:broad specificity phosphatase PhoE
MSHATPIAYLVRHGETEWSRLGRHTGLSDIPLTPDGERAARLLTGLLAGQAFSAVWTSPLRRAHRTCDLVGLGDRAVVDGDLVEWDYGDYEGRRSDEIISGHPGWSLFRDGCPGGEGPAQVGARADRVLARLRADRGPVAIFSSGHLLRALAARWLGLDVEHGRLLALGTASLSVLGFEHGDRDPAILRWNQQAAP